MDDTPTHELPVELRRLLGIRLDIARPATITPEIEAAMQRSRASRGASH